MKHHVALSALTALILAFSMAPAFAADTAADTEQVQRQAVASAAGVALQSVEIKHTAHQLTVTVLNSKHNNAALSERENVAVDMASAMER